MFTAANKSDAVLVQLKIKKYGGSCGLEVKRAPGDQGVRGLNPASYHNLFLEDQPIDILEKDVKA